MRRAALSGLALLLAIALRGAEPARRMEVVLLGTGFPAPDPDRAGPSTAVLVGEKTFVVDAGRGVTMRLAAVRPRPSRLDAVLLTHLHSDHVAGLADLWNTTWVMGRKSPLALYGPEGTRELVAGMKGFLAADLHIRRDLTEMLAPEGAEVDVHLVKPGAVLDDGEVKVTAFPVNHAPVAPAFGYRFEALGRKVVISGDTGSTPAIAENAKGADVLVHEVCLPEYFDRVERSPEAAARLKRYHSSPEQAAASAAKAGVKLLVFTHVIPKDGGPEILERARKVFAGRIVVGKDLDRF